MKGGTGDAVRDTFGPVSYATLSHAIPEHVKF
jgi:hypothetical protein